jgi:hypothetical protein
MSTFKKLNRQDVFVSDYVAKKQWEVTSSLQGDYGIETLRGFSGSTPGYPYPLDYRNDRYEKLVFDSINHSFYADRTGDGIFSGSRDLSLQTTLTYSGSRYLQSEVGVISFPKDIYGVHIEPGTVSIKPIQEEVDKYIQDSYIVDKVSGVSEYIENLYQWYGSNEIDTEDYIIDEGDYVDESEEEYTDIDQGQQRFEIVDDGDGNLIYSGSEKLFTQPKKIIGDIVYNQGLAIITDPTTARYISTYSRHKLRWKSNLPIYTYNVHCKVKDSEMNFTYNPTAVSGPEGVIASNVTGSAFSPYITTIGLYNDANELIAVAKTGRPVPKPLNTDMTLVVKIDL